MLLKKQIKKVNSISKEVLWMIRVPLLPCRDVCNYYKKYSDCMCCKRACASSLREFITRRYIPKNAAKEKIDKE